MWILRNQKLSSLDRLAREFSVATWVSAPYCQSYRLLRGWRGHEPGSGAFHPVTPLTLLFIFKNVLFPFLIKHSFFLGIWASSKFSCFGFGKACFSPTCFLFATSWPRLRRSVRPCLPVLRADRSHLLLKWPSAFSEGCGMSNWKRVLLLEEKASWARGCAKVLSSQMEGAKKFACFSLTLESLRKRYMLCMVHSWKPGTDQAHQIEYSVLGLRCISEKRWIIL